MQTKFLHTSDWQLGVTRHFLSEDSQARWTEARYEGVRNIGRIASEEGCEFVVVAGDIFESNQVDRKTISKACEAMSSIKVPIYLLPANHDPLDAGSIFINKHWLDRKPSNVHVITSSSDKFEVKTGVEVVGAPWTSKRPLSDLVETAANTFQPLNDGLRIMLGHGAVDQLSPDRNNPAVINVLEAEKAIKANRYHYLALGDRHSLTKVGSSGRIYYSGTHEAYDFDEVDPGKVLIVNLSSDTLEVSHKQNGTWKFLVHKAEVSTTEDIEALSRFIETLPNKEKTVLKLGLVGTLGIQAYAQLEEFEEYAKELFGAVIRSESRSELSIMPDGEDFSKINLSGFAESAVKKLLHATSKNESCDEAADALALLVRLAGRSA